MSKVRIAPSILSGDFAKMGESVESAEKWGADWIHCDVMDGSYVSNLTFGMPMIAAIRKHTALPLDVHLMIMSPEKYVERFASSGADIITFHPDASSNPAECLAKIKNCGKIAGIALNPDVSIKKYSEIIPLCDIVVVMTVYAGYGGQKLIPQCLDRAREIAEIREKSGKNFLIEIDGGITEENARAAMDSGADILVAGSSVYRSDDPTETIRRLRGDK